MNGSLLSAPDRLTASDGAVARTALSLRNAFLDGAHVTSRLMFEGEDRRPPLVTIAIPTYRRPHLLLEAIASAIGQQLDQPVEVIVVDNDPASRGWEEVVARLPQVRHLNFRYYVNDDNLGMFGNWNRCIELGRGEWHTLLNDDDLLDPDFLATMLAILGHGRFDVLVCRKRTLDQRATGRAAPPGVITRAMSRAFLEARFRGAEVRPLPIHKFFFGSPAGNTVGLIARKADLLLLGGYYAEDYPSADQYFMARITKRFRFGETRQTLVSIRTAENESARPEVIRGFIRRNQELRNELAGRDTPRWWLRLSPLIVARHRGQLQAGFGAEISEAEVRDILGFDLPRDRKLLFYLVCGAVGGL